MPFSYLGSQLARDHREVSGWFLLLLGLSLVLRKVLLVVIGLFGLKGLTIRADREKTGNKRSRH